jgi:hypothetical protein
MIRPVAFGYNPETAINNAFQRADDTGNVQEKALKEFDAFVDLLRTHGIEVLVVEDTPQPLTPDSIFPNNWFSTHDDGTLCLYPMFAENRRYERKDTVLETIRSHFQWKDTISFINYEAQGKFLEGTGSMILDRDNRIVYACLSPRTDKDVLFNFCHNMNYTPCWFDASDEHGTAIYHTNVMLCIAEHYAIACLDAVKDTAQRRKLTETIESTGKTIIPITLQQMAQFAGNMLEVANKQGEHFLVMSGTAYRSLSKEQLSAISCHAQIIHPELPTIETNGGGSARCMMAEIFLPK